MVGATRPPIFGRDPLGDAGREHDVDVHRHVRPVLLGRAERQEDDGAPPAIFASNSGQVSSAMNTLSSCHLALQSIAAPPFDADALPGHEGRARPGEEDDGRGDLFRPRRSGRADCSASLAQRLRRGRFEAEQRRVGRAGRDRR